MHSKRKYELALVLRTEELTSVLAVLAKQKILILKESNFSRIKLSYPISKEEYGYFGYLQFECESVLIKNLKEDLKKNSEALRFLIIALSKKEDRYKNLSNQILESSQILDEAIEKILK